VLLDDDSIASEYRLFRPISVVAMDYREPATVVAIAETEKYVRISSLLSNLGRQLLF